MTNKEAIKILEKNKPTSDPRLCGKELCQACDTAIRALQEPERKHGEWMDAFTEVAPNPMYMYGECSECGFMQNLSKRLSFCPRCGAKMDRGEV